MDELLSEQLVENKIVFPTNAPPSLVTSSQVYAAAFSNVTSAVRATVAFERPGGIPQLA